jgi:hypothetical protein
LVSLISACESTSIISVVSKWRPFSFIFNRGNREKWGGWETTVTLFLVKLLSSLYLGGQKQRIHNHEMKESAYSGLTEKLQTTDHQVLLFAGLGRKYTKLNVSRPFTAMLWFKSESRIKHQHCSRYLPRSHLLHRQLFRQRFTETLKESSIGCDRFSHDPSLVLCMA